jgi:hypothetical protein
MIELIGKIVAILTKAIEAGIRSGKTIREALAAGLEETAQGIRDGKLNIDSAIERAEKDRDVIASKRARFKD